MYRARYLVLHAAITLAATAPAYAQRVTPPGALSEISVPGGLKAALAAVGDRAAPDRSHFLIEFIRRTYDTPIILKTDQRAAALHALLEAIDRAAAESGSAGPAPRARSSRAQDPLARSDGAPPGGDDTLPLPLTPAIWTDVVFGGRVTADTVVRSILASREASLFYYGLMSLDDDTRAWLASEPALVKELASRCPGAFVAAAPGLRVRAGQVHVPGGTRAEPAWEAIAGRRVRDPAAFTRALLTEKDGALAWYFGAMAQLSPTQVAFALNLDSADAAAPAVATRRLYGVFQSLAWKVEARTFWRPSLDPALLVSGLSLDQTGRPNLPGTELFWRTVFARQPPRDDIDPHALGGPVTVDVASVAEQIFDSDALERRSRYNVVLFASRRMRGLSVETARDILTAVRAAREYPALVVSLERAGIDDLAVVAVAARRAAELSSIGDHEKAARALAQFQGALALVTRTGLTGNLTKSGVTAAVAAVSAIDVGKHGDYEGRIGRWLGAFVRDANTPAAGSGVATNAGMASASSSYDDESLERVPGDFDRDVIHVVAGPAGTPARFVDWEGTRYRLDVAAAERIRLARLFGERHSPCLTSARALLDIADAVADQQLTPDALHHQMDALLAAGDAVGWERANRAAGRSRADVPSGYTRAVAELGREAARTKSGNGHARSRIAESLRGLADRLLARGLTEFAYAVAMGTADRKPISVAEAAGRHDFKGEMDRRPLGGAWRLPTYATRSSPQRVWHLTGSLLGLDVALADLSLVRLSSRPPSRRPTLSDEDRRVMIESVVLANSLAFSDTAGGMLLDAMRKGRSRVAALHTDAEARAVAAEIGLGAGRTSLLSWLLAHDPARVGVFLSPVEILWAGLEGRPVDGAFQAWGASAEPRLGCLCVELLDRRPWETLAGRWNLGVLASGFPDLNLRLMELLADLKMPAPLLQAVLAAATLDFTENATSRDPDDRRGPVEFVQALGTERVEQYVALFTTDGPLFPSGDVAEGAPSLGRPGGSR